MLLTRGKTDEFKVLVVPTKRSLLLRGCRKSKAVQLAHPRSRGSGDAPRGQKGSRAPAPVESPDGVSLSGCRRVRVRTRGMSRSLHGIQSLVDPPVYLALTCPAAFSLRTLFIHEYKKHRCYWRVCRRIRCLENNCEPAVRTGISLKAVVLTVRRRRKYPAALTD